VSPVVVVKVVNTHICIFSLEHVLSNRERQQRETAGVGCSSSNGRDDLMGRPGKCGRKYHSYVNVDLMPRTRAELHRTNNSRQEFLSSQPGGFNL
jgi:hypothetical protein